MNDTDRILVVDDEPFVRDLLSDFFTKMEFDVTTAPDGDSALRMTRAESFDVALVDLKMPGKGGIEVLAELGQMDSTLPVIMMTGYPTIDSSIEAIRRGAYDYIVKPFKLQELKELVDRAIKERSLTREISDMKERLSTLEEAVDKLKLAYERNMAERSPQIA